MTEHKERKHALLSASGAHRWTACPPSALLEAKFPDTTSDAAEEGTLAHELAESKVKNYFLLDSLDKRKLRAVVTKLKKSPLWDDEMDGYTDEYLDYVRSAALAFENQPYVAIEKQVEFGTWVPEGFGTADCILIGGGTIHIIDFKYGKSPAGRVEAENNPQMILYALGAYDAYKTLYPVRRIKMSIVQPRLPDGISEWDTTIDALLGQGEWIRERAALAVKGEGEFHPDDKACRFCRAKASCRARAEKNVALAFSDGVGKLPPLISNEEMGRYLRQGTDVAKWLSDLQEKALSECLAGREVPGWKAVEGRGSREWTDMDQAFAALKGSGIDETMLWEKKPLSLAQVEKTVGKKAFAECVGGYVIKKPGKPALVEETDKRPAVTNVVTAAEAFQ